MTTAPRWDGPPLDAWAAWTPAQAARELAGVDAPWAVVGGWSIDLWLGRETRAHGDLEIAVPRGFHAAMRAHLSAYTWFVVGDGEVIRADAPDAPTHHFQHWLLDVPAGVWRIDVMLEDGDASTWRYRRDPRITRPRSEAIGTRDGIPYLTPECALLFKAKSPEGKHAADFEVTLPTLDDAQRAWLHDALHATSPEHVWLARLRSSVGDRRTP